MKVKLLAAILIACVLLTHMESVSVTAGPEDCIDGCYTGCVNANSRLMSRCEAKCRVKCGPGGATGQVIGR